MLLQKAPEGEDTKGSGVIAKVADFGLAQVGVMMGYPQGPDPSCLLDFGSISQD